MSKLSFRAGELYIRENNGTEYLNIGKASNESLIKEARDLGVKNYEDREETDEETTDED